MLHHIRVPPPLAHQVPILSSPARYKVAACGRRWGKTMMGLLMVIRGHGPQPGFWKGAMRGGNIWWVAPTFSVAAKIWRDLKFACGGAWTNKNETQRRIEFPGGGSVTVRSADRPDTLRGEGLDGLVIDESAFIAPQTWSDVLRPTLSDRRGWAVFISTPNGRNWFYDLFRNAEKHGKQNGWESWRRPTSDNPIIAPSELDAARLEIGSRAFAQEYMAHFADVAGAEFSGDYFHEGVWYRQAPHQRDIRFRVMALDPSKGESEKSDYSALVMLCLDWRGTMWIDADLARRDIRAIIDDCLRWSSEFHPHAVGVEINQFQSLLADNLAEASRSRGVMLPIHGIENRENKRTRIRATLTPYLARGEFRFRAGSPGARLLVEQLQAFPVGDYDDGPDALEMAVRLTRHLFAQAME